MLWTQLRAGLGSDSASPDEASRLTMVVLRATGVIDSVEAAFYQEAELGALVDGAAAGLIVLAFIATSRDELILFSAEPVERVEMLVAQLPFVAAGLVRSEVSEVCTLRLGLAKT